jgi:hypothetical protein
VFQDYLEIQGNFGKAHLFTRSDFGEDAHKRVWNEEESDGEVERRMKARYLG